MYLGSRTGGCAGLLPEYCELRTPILIRIGCKIYELLRLKFDHRKSHTISYIRDPCTVPKSGFFQLNIHSQGANIEYISLAKYLLLPNGPISMALIIFERDNLLSIKCH